MIPARKPNSCFGVLPRNQMSFGLIDKKPDSYMKNETTMVYPLTERD